MSAGEGQRKFFDECRRLELYRMSAHAALQAEDLHKAYPIGRGRQPVQALDGLSFEVAAGTVYGLLGPNGAGKSTTVKILSTLSTADSGTATVAGLDVRRDPNAVRRRIGLVSQRPSSDPMGTGRENLLLAARIHGLNRSDARARATWLLDRFGLSGAADRLVKTWSGGMVRKLDVAIGLVHRPDVLFLDEPTTGLDPQARHAMWGLIEQMHNKRKTILMTTHYMEEAERLCDRVAIVDRGRIVAIGSPKELIRDAFTESAVTFRAEGAEHDALSELGTRSSRL